MGKIVDNRFRLHSHLDSLTEMVRSQLEAVLSSVGIEDRLCLFPSIMLADWSTYGLRYALPHWFHAVSSWALKNGSTKLEPCGIPFAERAKLSRDRVDEYVEELTARYLEQAHRDRDIWTLFHGYEGPDEKLDPRVSFRRLLVEEPCSDLDDIALLVLGLVPQPMGQGLAGHVFARQHAVSLKLDDHRFPTYPDDVPTSRETRDLDYLFMQFLEQSYIGLKNPHLVVSPVTEDVHRLGVLIAFVFPKGRSRIRGSDMEKIARRMGEVTKNSRLSVALTAVITSGIGELTVHSILRGKPQDVRYLLIGTREQETAKRIIASISKFVPCPFSGVMTQDHEGRWCLATVGEYHHTTYPDYSLVDLRNPTPAEDDGLLSGDGPVRAVRWRPTSQSYEGVVLFEQLGDPRVAKISLPMRGNQIPSQQRRETMRLFRQQGLMRGNGGTAMLVPLSSRTLIFVCLPFRKGEVDQGEFSLLGSLTSVLHDYISAFEFYQEGQRDIINMMTHETAHFFLGLPGVLQKLHEVILAAGGPILKHKLPGRELDENPRSSVGGALKLSTAAAEHANAVFRGIRALTQLRREGVPGHFMQTDSVDELLSASVSAAKDRLRAKFHQKLLKEDALSRLNVDLESIPGLHAPAVPFRVVVENLLANAMLATVNSQFPLVRITISVSDDQFDLTVYNTSPSLVTSKGTGLFLCQELCEELGWQLLEPMLCDDHNGLVRTGIRVPITYKKLESNDE